MRTKTVNAKNWRSFMNDRTADWKKYREEEFRELVTTLVDLSKIYNWSCWVGGTKNPLSITLSAFVGMGKSKSVSIRLAKDIYMASFVPEINPNNIRASDFTYQVGKTVKECEEFVCQAMEQFRRDYGDPSGKAVYATARFPSKGDINSMIQYILQNRDWYQYT